MQFPGNGTAAVPEMSGLQPIQAWRDEQPDYVRGTRVKREAPVSLESSCQGRRNVAERSADLSPNDCHRGDTNDGDQTNEYPILDQGGPVLVPAEAIEQLKQVDLYRLEHVSSGGPGFTMGGNAAYHDFSQF